MLPYHIIHPAQLQTASLAQHAELNLRDRVTAVARCIVSLASAQVI